MRAERFLLLLPLGLIFLGCIPERDNPADPAIRPAAVLSVVEIPRDGVHCPTTAVPATGAAIEVSTRSVCLALDAGQSDVEGVTFGFQYLNDGTPEVLRAASSDPVFVLSTAFVLQLEVGVPHVFQVSAVKGRSVTNDEATLFLTNRAPAASISPTRTIPAGGYPWNPQPFVDLVFSGAGSSDPDADPLQYCWTFSPNGVDPDSPPCSASAEIVRRVPTAGGRTIASLVVGDGAATSSPVRTTVDVRQENVWVAPRSGYGEPFSRLDSVRHSFPAYDHPTDVQLTRNVTADVLDRAVDRMAIASRPVSGVGSDSVTLTTAPFPLAEPTATPLVIPHSGTFRIAADGARNRIWGYFAGNPGGTFHLRSFLVDATSGAVTPEVVMAPIPLVGGGNGPRPTIAADGSAWTMADGRSRKLIQVEPTGPQGALTVVADADGEEFWGVQARPARPGDAPNEGQVWAIRQRIVAGDAQSAQLVVWSVPGAVPVRVHDIGHIVGKRLAWNGPDEFWIFVGGIGLVRVDATALDQGVSFDEAILERFEDVPDPTELLSIPGGGCWSFGSLLGTFLVNPGRDPVVFAPGQTFTGHAVDPDGALWFSGALLGTRFSRGLSVDPMGEISDLTLATFALAGDPVVVDQATGGIWAMTGDVYARALERRAEDGTLTEYHSTIAGVGPDLSFGQVAAFWIAPDASRAYALTGGGAPPTFPYGVYSIDLAVSPPTFAPLLDDPTAGAVFGGGLDLFIPSAPVPSSTPFVWAARDAMAMKIVTFDTLTAQETVRFTVPPSEAFYDVNNEEPYGQPRGALAPGSNRLCLATVDTLDRVHLRLVEPGGVQQATDLALIQLPTNPFSSVYQVSATSDPVSGDVCWILYGARPAGASCTTGSATVEAWKAVGGVPTLLHSRTEPLFAAGLTATSADSVWLDLRSCVTATPFLRFPTTLMRLDWTSSGLRRWTAATNKDLTLVPK